MHCRICGAVSDVKETRKFYGGLVIKRRRVCHNDHQFWTIEVDAALEPSIRDRLRRHIRGAETDIALRKRNRAIVQAVLNGTPVKEVAAAHGLKPHTVSYVLKKHGVEDRRRKSKLIKDPG